MLLTDFDALSTLVHFHFKHPPITRRRVWMPLHRRQRVDLLHYYLPRAARLTGDQHVRRTQWCMLVLLLSSPLFLFLSLSLTLFLPLTWCSVEAVSCGSNSGALFLSIAFTVCICCCIPTLATPNPPPPLMLNQTLVCRHDLWTVQASSGCLLHGNKQASTITTPTTPLSHVERTQPIDDQMVSERCWPLNKHERK